MIARTTTALLAALVAGPLLGQTNVGVVDLGAVVQNSEKGKAAFAEVEQFRKQKLGELQALADEFQAKQADLQAKRSSLSEDRVRELTLELERLQTDITRKQEDAEREGQRKTNQALESLDKELAPLVIEVAKERNLHLVLQNVREVGIVYVDQSIDITADVIARLDAADAGDPEPQ
jgi:Skp family chaperone for outer membrane proteins